MPHTFKPGTIIGILFSLILSATGATAGGYRITDLGRGIIPAAINRNGDVTGTMVSPFSTPEAFLRRSGVVTKLGLLGGAGSWGLAINDTADVVGSICLEEKCKMNPHWGAHWHAFIVRKGEGMEATKIDNSQLEPVEIDRTALPHRREATVLNSVCGSWLCSGSNLNSKVSFLSLPGNRWVSWGATAINEKPQIASPRQTRKGAPTFSAARDTGIFRFVPAAINNSGIMVGCAEDTSLLLRKAKPRPKWAPNKLNGASLDAPCVPATFADGKATALVEQLAVEGDDWIIEGVFDLNDNGEIIGYGTKNGQPLHGFILSPSR